MRTASSANTVAVGPGRDQRAEVEHEDPLDEAAHEVDVVLDEQDRDPLLLLHATCSLTPSASVSCRSRPDDGSSSSTSFGSVISARPISTRRPTPRLSDSTGRSATDSSPSSSSIAVGLGVLVGGRPAQEQHVLPQRAAPVADPLGDEEVLARRHAAEQLDALERAPDPEPGALVRRDAR